MSNPIYFNRRKATYVKVPFFLFCFGFTQAA